jgi:hypothetical protein
MVKYVTFLYTQFVWWLHSKLLLKRCYKDLYLRKYKISILRWYSPNFCRTCFYTLRSRSVWHYITIFPTHPLEHLPEMFNVIFGLQILLQYFCRPSWIKGYPWNQSKLLNPYGTCQFEACSNRNIWWTLNWTFYNKILSHPNCSIIISLGLLICFAVT